MHTPYSYHARLPSWPVLEPSAQFHRRLKIQQGFPQRFQRRHRQRPNVHFLLWRQRAETVAQLPQHQRRLSLQALLLGLGLSLGPSFGPSFCDRSLIDARVL